MTKHLTLLLFIGLAWGQENTDTLILRDGSVFSGKYLGIIFGGVKFETIDNNIVKPPVKSIQKLSINGLTIIGNGQWVLPKEFVKNSQGNINQQSYDNYQHDYQQGVAAAKKYWAEPKKKIGLISNLNESQKNLLQLKGNGFRDGHRKEMAKLINKRGVKRIKRTTTCCLLWFVFIGFEGRDMPWAIGG